MAGATTNFTIAIPTALIQRIATAFTASYGYQAQLSDGSDNPTTPIQFTQQQVAAYIKNVVMAYEASAAADTARQAAMESAETDLAF